MKRLLIAAILTTGLLLASACDETTTGCTQCGFQANEHIVTSYLDSEGATIYVSGYANSSGCFTPDGCR